MVDHAFLKQDFKDMLLFNDHVDTMLNDLEAFEFPKSLKWS
jgi:hypothetical protein